MGRSSACFCLALFISGGTLTAQTTVWKTPGPIAARADLQETLARFEAASRSAAYSEALRARAREAATAVRRRLQEGDFRVGDQVILSVEGEAALSETFIVGSGRILELPLVGAVSLIGVLRSELESHLSREIGRFITQPDLRASSFIRVSIEGELGQPGFHLFPAETPLPEVVMAVGGATPRAQLAKMWIERAGERVWHGGSLQLALREGLTLDELGIQSGDKIVVPGRPMFSVGEIFRAVGILAGTLWAINRVL
jgi:protein involved in polysaccharide export with SLBB domain